MHGRTAVPGTEVELAWSAAGAGEPALVLMHGFTGSRLDWDHVVGGLAADRRVITYDCRGHGESSHTGDAASYNFASMGDDLEAVVGDLTSGPIDLLGHSMAGVVAITYALRHPELVRSLLLLDTAAAPSAAEADSVIGFLGQVGRTNGMSAVADLIISFLASTRTEADEGAHAGDGDALERLLRTNLERLDPEAFVGFGAELTTYPSLVDDLAGLALPVTVMVGENDSGLRASADTLAAAIPGARLAVLAGTGHNPHIEDPVAWTAVVRDHLDRLAP